MRTDYVPQKNFYTPAPLPPSSMLPQLCETCIYFIFFLQAVAMHPSSFGAVQNIKKTLRIIVEVCYATYFSPHSLSRARYIIYRIHIYFKTSAQHSGTVTKLWKQYNSDGMTLVARDAIARCSMTCEPRFC